MSDATTTALPMEDRIKRWRDETSGDETEGVIELLCDAEEELRRRAVDRDALLAELKSINGQHVCVCRLNPLAGLPVPCETCVTAAVIAKAEAKS